MCVRVKMETSDGETEGIVKKEETLDLSISKLGDDVSNAPQVISIKEEADKDYLCKTLGTEPESNLELLIFSIMLSIQSGPWLFGL